MPVRFCQRSAVPIVVFERTDRLVGRRGPYALRRALHGARPPGLVLVREPDELGLERAHPQLALGARLVELAEANGHVAAADTTPQPATTSPAASPKARAAATRPGYSSATSPATSTGSSNNRNR